MKMTPRRTFVAAAATVLMASTTFAFTPVPYEKVIVPPSSVTSSGDDGHVAQNTVDGSLSTRWSASGDGAWVAYGLGAQRTLTHVRIAVYAGNTRKNRFDLQVSADGQGWTTARTLQSSGTTTALESFDLGDTPARFVRYLGHGNVSNGGVSSPWNSVSELEIYARPVPPPAPTGLRAQTGNGQVLLTWPVVSGAVAYDVYRSGQDCNGYQFLVRVMPQSGSPQSYLDTAATPGARTLYSVTAQTPAGAIAFASPVSITPAVQAPSVTRVTAAAVGAAGSGRIDVSWQPVFSATRYAVERNTRDGRCPVCRMSGFSVLASVDAPETTFSDVTAAPGNYYEYRIVASNGAGSGDVSNTTPQIYSSYATPTPTPIGPTPTPCGCPSPTPTPAAISAAPAAPALTVRAGSAKVLMQWPTSSYAQPDRASTYAVFRGDTACGPFVKIAQRLAPTSSTPLSYQDDGLVNGRTYYYLVVGANAMGESTNVAGTAATPFASVPAAPANVQTYAYLPPGPRQIEVYWPNVWDADTYNVKRGTTSGGPYTTIATGVTWNPNSTAATHLDTTIAAGTTYYYVVSAVNASGEGPISAEAPGRVEVPPPSPTGLVATATGSAGQVRLEWNAAAGAQSYSCARGVNAGGPYDWLDVQNTTATSALVGMLTNDQRHYFVCFASGSAGASAFSNEASAVPIGIPAPPTGVQTLVVRPGASRCLEVGWNTSAGAVGYHVRRGTVSGGATSLLATASQTLHTDCTAVVGTRYYYRVTSFAASGESQPSLEATGLIPSEILVTPPASRVTASTNDGDLPANTVDDSLDTRWSGGGDGAWIQYDLGAPQTVSSLRIGVYRGNERKNVFDVQASSNGTSWTTLRAGVRTSGTTTAQELVDIPDTAARYVRYVGHGATLNAGGTSAWNSVTEVDLYAVP
jgi:fibronectin type 3 domain-containing protein